MRDEEYFAIKERAAASLLRIPHVNAVGIGGRERNGRPTGEIVIKVFVTKKKPATAVPPDEMIPASFEGVPTDVVEMSPRLRPHMSGVPRPTTDTMDESLTDPMQGGMMISVDFPGGITEQGTLGCFLLDRQDGTAVYALTNHHIVTNGRLSQSRPVKQPTGMTGVLNATPIGYPAAGEDDKFCDAAVIRLEPDLKWMPAIKDIGFINGTHEVTVAEAATQTYRVRKRGARTLLTDGVVIAIGVQNALFLVRSNFDMVIRPNDLASNPTHQQIVFSDRGDSGSAIVNDQNEIVALLWGGEFDSDQQFPITVACPILIVLKRFLEKDHLDLKLAISTSASPTDASETRVVLPPAGVPPATLPQVFETADRGHHRPLSGGSQIVAEPFGFGNSGTFGCVVTRVGDPDTAYVLTSQAGLSGSGAHLPSSTTKVGQPDNSSSCSLCCINTVGTFSVGGPDDATLPVALVQLGKDQKWLAEVMQIGVIEGTKTVTSLDVSLHSYRVRKRGASSRLTGGIVTAVGGVQGDMPPGVRPDAIIIRPHPNPLRPGQDIAFSLLNDRGAVVVNENNKVVGVLYDTVSIPDGGAQIIHGVALPIQIVLDQFNALPGISVEVAHETDADQVHTTAHRVAVEEGTSTVIAARRARHARPAFELDVSAAPDALLRLQTQLSRSRTGRVIAALWSEHRDEIRHLVDHNRKVATVWHRCGGPALLQSLLRVLQRPAALVPATVNGVPIADSLDRLARVLCKYGSQRLQLDIACVQPHLPRIGGLSFDEILLALNEQ